MSKVQAESLGNKSRNKYLFIAALLYCGFNFQQRVYPQFVAAILLRLYLLEASCWKSSATLLLSEQLNYFVINKPPAKLKILTFRELF